MFAPNPEVEMSLRFAASAHKFTCGDLEASIQLLRLSLCTDIQGHGHLALVCIVEDTSTSTFRTDMPFGKYLAGHHIV